jgi:WXG100 protein secretion system (Wss), protein YukD
VDTITITISLYDASRRAEVTLPTSMSVGDLMDQCSRRWSLPHATFVFRLIGSDELLLEGESLRLAGVRDGDELQIYPILEGG